MAKDSLVKGTIILMAAAFAARFLGAVQRVPLQALLGDQGMADYGIAYNIYFMLLIIATAGLPSAISKLVSGRLSLGREEEARNIYRAAVRFAVVAGFLMAILLFVAAPYYARLSGDPEATLAVRALAPALLLFPLIAIMRGYFQGRQQMMANGLSQIVEQILRVITAVLLAYWALQAGLGKPWASAGASFGGVMGSIGAVLIMAGAAWRLARDRKGEGGEAKAGAAAPASAGRTPYRAIYAELFRIAVPISLISLAVPLINAIDSTTVIPLLQGMIGHDEAKTQLGIMAGRAQSLAGIPIILAVALSQSIVPVISSAFAKNDRLELERRSSQALRMSVLTGLPMVLALTAAAQPVNGLLFGDTDGTGIVVMMVISAMFQILMTTSGAILMGLGQMRAPTLHVFAGVAVKLVASLALSQIWGIYGIIAATMLCFIVTMALNLIHLRKTIRFRIVDGKWGRLGISVLLLAAWGYAWQAATDRGIGLPSGWIDYAVRSILIGGLVLAAYPPVLALLRVVGKQDWEAMPAPLRRLAGRFGARRQPGS